MAVRPTPGHLHKSLVRTIVEDIEERIVQGELKPGERLVELVMCKMLDVSRSPLREAFRILEDQGFLVNRARKGVFVSTLTKKEAIDIYTIRASLESLATFLAVQAEGERLSTRLRSVQRKMADAVGRGDLDAYTEYNSRFHDEIILSCGNDLLIEMLRRFNRQTARYRAMIRSTKGRPEESVKKHEELIKSIESGDAALAEMISRESILHNIELVETIFKDEEEAQ
jgi:DNA-binding GntR family transcriptional regulator